MSEPPSTDDGHYFLIEGRRWRATDPAIPEERRAELTRVLSPRPKPFDLRLQRANHHGAVAASARDQWRA